MRLDETAVTRSSAVAAAAALVAGNQTHAWLMSSYTHISIHALLVSIQAVIGI
jgi:hypothetical protein